MNSENSSIAPEIIQGSSDDASLPPVIPPNTKSGYKNIGIEDGKKVVVAATEMIPLVGSFLSKFVEYGLQAGEYSPEERLKALQYDWLIKEVHKISAKLDQLFRELPVEEHPSTADVAATLEAALKVSQKTADYKKRQRLKQALVSAFDKEQYKQGLTLRLFSILEELEYGDFYLLREIYKIENKPKEQIVNSNLSKYLGENLPRKLNRIDHKRIPPFSLDAHHIGILNKHNLIHIGSGEFITVTELGKRFLKFIYKEPEEDSEDS